MPDPNAIVSRVIRVEPPPDRSPDEVPGFDGGYSIALEVGREVRADPQDPNAAGYARILEGLSKLGRPAYLEVDPESGTIRRLLIPHVARVVAIRPAGDGYEVELEYSHAIHRLKRGRPDFPELEKALRDSHDRKSPIVLTEDDSHQIIDIRPFTKGPDDGTPALIPAGIGPYRSNPLSALLYWIWCWPVWPWWWFWRGCVSRARAQEVFDAMSATTCNPLTVPPPCIPFLYPDDGCWGRAHEMCRLMIAMGLSPRKVWIQGSLQTPTRNNPNCVVYWAWHVAPTLCVRWRWWFWTRRMVIDPSLFTTPVSEAAWKGVQGDPGASLTPSDASIFYLWGNVTDPTYAQTNQVLATYRLQLQNRSIQVGPPPYANCP
ncbi:MAG TPA: protein-glutamine glutaminase family protein [Allosphingosinicella sp.]